MNTRPGSRAIAARIENSVAVSSTGLPPTVDAEARDVEHEVAGLDSVARLGGSRAASEHGANAGDELARAERLGHVVVRAELQPEERVELGVPRGQDDDRRRAGGADRPDHLQPLDLGEAEVEDDEVGLSSPDGLQRRRAVAGRQDREAGVLEVVARQLDDLGFVIDDEDGLHRGSL